jgi:formate C-acetyltransferase
MPIRRALALEAVLESMTIHIYDGELIVGNHASGRRAGPVFPEWGVHWLESELDEIDTRPQDKMCLPEQVKQELLSIIPYWRGKTVYDKVWGSLPDEVKKARTSFVFTVDLFERGSFGHMIYDSPSILKNGLREVRNQIAAHLAEADPADPNQIKRIIFWQAADIICRAVISFAHRYAAEARCQTLACEDPERRKELLKIAGVCDWVPENPARDFWEAVQTLWFLQLAIQIEGNGNSVSMGRLDQHLYPYFQKELACHNDPLSYCQELLDCLWIKLNELVKVWDAEAARVHAGWPMTQNVMIGGQTSGGLDATNELSFLILNTQEHVKLAQPQFSMRVHSNTPPELLVRACEVIKGGGGMPALFGDQAVIGSLLSLGIPIAEARNYGMVGCVEPSVIGAFGRNNGGYFNLARIVDMAINDGVDRLTGAQLGLKTGDPSRFENFDEVLDAVKKQMAHFVHLLAIEDNLIDMVQEELTPLLFASSLIPDCIAKGADITSGGARYHWTTPFGAGVATAGDSLAAIKQCVFDERKLTLPELNCALDVNFEGSDGAWIRHLLRKAPKYGNDLGAADYMVRLASDMFHDEVQRYPTWRGGRFVGGLFTLSATVPHGWRTGATADGRQAKAPISDSISPTNGADSQGPTAVLLSASKLDHMRCGGGNVLNMKFTPGALESHGSLSKFVALLKTYLTDLGGFEAQINVASVETLRAAQKNPEQYRDLIIRVSGYSARFVELAQEIQDDIIGRTEHLAV